MLHTCNNTLALHTSYGLGRPDTSKEGVGAPAFPVPASLHERRQHRGEDAQQVLTAATRPKFVMGPSATLTPFPRCSAPMAWPRWLIRFLSKVAAALIAAGLRGIAPVSEKDEGFRGGAQCRDKVRKTDAKGRVLKAETLEAEASYFLPLYVLVTE